MSFKPIYSPANDIIQAFQVGHQQATDTKKLALEQARLSQEKELEQERLQQQKDIEEARLKQQHELESKHIDLLQQAHELQKILQTQELNQKYQETGAVPSGATVTKPIVGVSGNPQEGFNNISATPGLDLNQVKLNIPGLGESTIASPEAASQRAGELALAREKPKFELESQKEMAKSLLALELEQKRLESQSAINEANRQSQQRIANTQAQARVTAAGVTRGGEIIKSTLDKFSTHPITQRFNIINETKNVADNIPDNSTDPVEQRELIYALAKAQDPQKVLSMGENNAIKDNLQSIADSLGLKLNSIMGSSGSFLNPAAIKSIKKQIQNRYSFEKESFKNVRSQMGATIKSLGGDPNWLPDYSSSGKNDPLNIRQ